MSKETKWTPGPWESDCEYIVGHGQDVDYENVCVVGLCKEMGANAHLIAAAPELYEALEYVIKQVPEFGSVPGIAETMAKARGEQ